MRGEQLPDHAAVGHGLTAIDRHDHVHLLEPGPLTGALRLNVLHDQAPVGRQVEHVDPDRIDHIDLAREAQPRMNGVAIVNDLAGHPGRHRGLKRQVHTTLPGQAVNAHNPSLQVDQGTAGIARMNRRIRNQEPIDREVPPPAGPGPVDRPLAAGNDPAGGGVLVAHGIADREDEEPHRRRAIVREDRRVHRQPVLDLQDRQEVERINPHTLGLPALAIGRLDRHFIILCDHLRTGNHVVVVKHNARPQGDLSGLRRGRVHVYDGWTHLVQSCNQGGRPRVHADHPHFSYCITFRRETAAYRLYAGRGPL